MQTACVRGRFERELEAVGVRHGRPGDRERQIAQADAQPLNDRHRALARAQAKRQRPIPGPRRLEFHGQLTALSGWHLGLRRGVCLKTSRLERGPHVERVVREVRQVHLGAHVLARSQARREHCVRQQIAAREGLRELHLPLPVAAEDLEHGAHGTGHAAGVHDDGVIAAVEAEALPAHQTHGIARAQERQGEGIRSSDLGQRATIDGRVVRGLFRRHHRLVHAEELGHGAQRGARHLHTGETRQQILFAHGLGVEPSAAQHARGRIREIVPRAEAPVGSCADHGVALHRRQRAAAGRAHQRAGVAPAVDEFTHVERLAVRQLHALFGHVAQPELRLAEARPGQVEVSLLHELAHADQHAEEASSCQASGHGVVVEVAIEALQGREHERLSAQSGGALGAQAPVVAQRLEHVLVQPQASALAHGDAVEITRYRLVQTALECTEDQAQASLREARSRAPGIAQHAFRLRCAHRGHGHRVGKAQSGRRRAIARCAQRELGARVDLAEGTRLLAA